MQQEYKSSINGQNVIMQKFVIFHRMVTLKYALMFSSNRFRLSILSIRYFPAAKETHSLRLVHLTVRYWTTGSLR